MLKWRLFFAFATSILFVAGVLFGTIYFVVYYQVVENTQSSYEMLFNQYAANLSGIVESCKSDMLSLAINDNIQSMLIDFQSGAHTSGLSEEIDGVMHTDEQSAFGRSGYLISAGMPGGRTRYKIVLYAAKPNGRFYQLTDSFARDCDSPAEAEDSSVLRAVRGKGGGFYTRLNSGGKTPHISLYKAVYDVDTFRSVIGVLSCEIPLEDIRAHFFTPLFGKYNISTSLIDPLSGERSSYGLSHGSVLETILLDGTRSYPASNLFVMEQSVNRGAFYLIGVASMASVNQSIFTALTAVSVSAVIALTLAFLFSLLYASYLTKPIKLLSDAMKSADYAEAQLPAPSNQFREICELYKSFHDMIDTINKLIYENYVIEINKKQSELNALQSQINTHFLYNTLDTVNWLAKDYGAENISLIVRSLSSLLRLSLNKGKELISMQGELEHVKSYVEIQKIRYDNQFCVEYQVDERALSAVVPKMLLQPLVENAIYHGFEHGGEHHLIRIEIRMIGGCIHERVMNNGSEIDLEKMQQLTSPSMDADPSAHYGVKNIAQRLELNYGDKASYYYTMENGFTVANIVIPCPNE